MILSDVIQGYDGLKRVVYFNMREKKGYYLTYDEFSEVSTEVPYEFNRQVVEPLLIRYLKWLDSSIQLLEGVASPSVEQKTELNRYKQDLEYLLNYEY